MMMRMLQAGGMSLLTDDVRTADEDNPQGYYEFEQVKQIEHDRAWLEDARGKVVKIISALLKGLPSDYTYQVIFMRRKMGEILASQRQMLVRRGEASDTIQDDRMAHLFQRHLEEVRAWLDGQPNVETLYVHYNEVLENPVEQAQRVNRFLGNTLDVAQMAAVVDPTLYRQQR